MMTVHFTCPECGSGVHVYPNTQNDAAQCDICQHEFAVKFSPEQEKGIVKDCPLCARQDFYSQPDFNRKLGVILYLIPTAICLFLGLIYGILAFFCLWMLDFFLFRRLKKVAICYNCQTIFRGAANIDEIAPFNHEMNDRIIYSGHDFKGETLNH
jgi:hypothetical protein